MLLVHMVQRLRLLAAWRTPGGPRPAAPCPIAEHILLREASDKLELLAADLEIVNGIGMKDAGWRHWAVVDDRTGRIVFAASMGRDFCELHINKALQVERDLNARNWVLRPIQLGHADRNAAEEEQ